MKKLAKLYCGFLYALPVVLLFSYYPIISLGTTASMNLELSLPLIWLTFFAILSIIIFIKAKLPISPKFLPLLIFPTYATITIFWSPNPLRAVLTAGIIWLLLIAIISITTIGKKFINRNIFAKFCRASVIFICAWCWLQSLLDLIGLPRTATLMCAGCTTTTFGFPHPNGFAIEPQFMGNLLLAPALYALYQIIKQPSRRHYALACLVFATLFLTFSRGAIYSFAVAALFLIVALGLKTKSARPLCALLPLAISFLFTLNAQGLFAVLSPTNDTYFTGVAKSLNQLSLGIIDLTPQVPAADDFAEKTEVEAENQPNSTFDGYVEESTNIRLELTAAALTAWRQNPTTAIFGTGLGGAGITLYREGLTDSPKEIVQNQYASLLLETGLVGIATLVIALIIIIKAAAKSSRPLFLFALLLAYALSLLFFAGLPNALHIYLVPSLFLPKHKAVIE